MAKKEGVIKFQLEFRETEALSPDDIREINAWRTIMHKLQLIGHDANRYDGYGFGNISHRVKPFDASAERRRFIVSGTQTGHVAILTGQQYAVVLESRADQNFVKAEGPIRPSSESLTHGVLYALDERIRWVIHVHSPELWTYAAALQIPTTHPHVPYGTPEMAVEVRRLFRETAVRERLIFAMGGHEDGIISFGRTAEEAGNKLINYLSRAYQLGDEAVTPAESSASVASKP